MKSSCDPQSSWENPISENPEGLHWKVQKWKWKHIDKTWAGKHRLPIMKKDRWLRVEPKDQKVALRAQREGRESIPGSGNLTEELRLEFAGLDFKTALDQ